MGQFCIRINPILASVNYNRKGWAQYCSNSSALAMKLPQSCTEPWILSWSICHFPPYYIGISSYQNCNKLITIIRCTCHDSRAVMACAKYCSDLMDIHGIKTNIFNYVIFNWTFHVDTKTDPLWHVDRAKILLQLAVWLFQLWRMFIISKICFLIYSLLCSCGNLLRFRRKLRRVWGGVGG